MRLFNKPSLNNPILIDGLPGIGLVASIATAHLIYELKAKLFGEIICSSFQNMSVFQRGKIDFPIVQLYYHKGDEKDLLIIHGNTQAATARGQYELCWCLLDVAQDMGCKYILTLGGFRPGREVTGPKLYFAASDTETAGQAEKIGAEILEGRIFGVAGLLVGLASVRGLRGLCLLAETTGLHPDEIAAKEILGAITQILNVKINTDDLQVSMRTVEAIKPFNQFSPKTI